MKAIFAGSFDPFTKGHYDIVARASKIFDSIVVAIAYDNDKNSVGDMDVRSEIIKRSCEDLKNIEVATFSGLLTDFMKAHGSNFLVRGLRNSSDFIYERDLNSIYKDLDEDIESIYLICDARLSHIYSSAVRELVRLGASVESCVCDSAKELIKEKYRCK